MNKGDTTKKNFKMPHLFWIMIGLLLFACLLTYIVPAGEFAVDENGKILGDQFQYLGHQTPVAPWRMFMLILQGLSDSGTVIWTVLTSGAMTAVVMATDVYKRQDLAKDPAEKRRTSADMPVERARDYNRKYIRPEQSKEPFASPVYAPVSYTHLDVYKRQGYDWWSMCPTH